MNSNNIAAALELCIILFFLYIMYININIFRTNHLQRNLRSDRVFLIINHRSKKMNTTLHNQLNPNLKLLIQNHKLEKHPHSHKNALKPLRL